MQYRERSYASQCEKKTRYDTKADARRGIRRMKSRPRELRSDTLIIEGAKLGPYKCPYCGTWHVGHSVDSKQLPHRQRGDHE